MKTLIIFLLFAINIAADDNYQKNMECEKTKRSLFEKAKTKEEFQFLIDMDCYEKTIKNFNNVNENNKYEKKVSSIDKSSQELYDKQNQRLKENSDILWFATLLAVILPPIIGLLHKP